MKKILRRIVTLVIVATLFVMPASSAYASSFPVVEYHMDTGATVVTFQPDPLFLAGGNTTCYDLVDESMPQIGSWYVPAGHMHTLMVRTLEKNTTARFIIYRNEVLVSDYVISSTSYGYNFCPSLDSIDVYWRYYIIPYTDLTLTGYTGVVTP